MLLLIIMSIDHNTLESLSPPKPLLTALYKMLRPIARLLIHYGITFPQMAELMKRAYVDVSENEFCLPNKAQTDTRLSLLTGINRKDIKRLRQQPDEEKDVPEVISTGSRLVALWVGDPAYQDDEGKPRSLPLKSKNDEISFETLVQEVCKQDLRPRVVLDQWLNLGVVTMSKDKHIKLNSDAFIPSKGFDEKAFFLGHNLSDHLSASTSNLIGGKAPFFERCVYYDGLSEDSIAQLEDLVANQGMKTLLEINDLAMRLKAKDSVEGHYKHRIDVGLYVYHESKEPDYD